VLFSESRMMQTNLVQLPRYKNYIYFK